MQTLLENQLLKYQSMLMYPPKKWSIHKTMYLSHLLLCAQTAYQLGNYSLASCDLRLIYMGISNSW